MKGKGRSGLLSAALAIVGLALSARAQAPAPASKPAVRPLGAVTAIDAARKQVTLKTDAGPELAVSLEDGAKFLRVAPGEKDLKNATRIAPTDVAIGDRILVRGRVSDDQKSVVATSVMVMTKADIAKKHDADRAEWQRRGIAGIITALNPNAKEVTISTPAREGRAEASPRPNGRNPLTITLASNAIVRRYAPDSVKFSDAKPSTLDELKVGDEVRALGNRSEDGGRFTADELVSGSFRNVAGTVISVDPTTSALKITDLASKKPLLVRVNADSTLRKLSPIVAQFLAMRRAGGVAGAAATNATPGAGAPSANGAPGNPSTTRAPGTMARPPDFQQMLDRMPALSLTDLKPGDAIIVASTVGKDPGQVTAITLLAGVEPLLTAAPGGGQQVTLGPWNLDMNMNMNLP